MLIPGGSHRFGPYTWQALRTWGPGLLWADTFCYQDLLLPTPVLSSCREIQLARSKKEGWQDAGCVSGSCCRFRATQD